MHHSPRDQGTAWSDHSLNKCVILCTCGATQPFRVALCVQTLQLGAPACPAVLAARRRLDRLDLQAPAMARVQVLAVLGHDPGH